MRRYFLFIFLYQALNLNSNYAIDYRYPSYGHPSNSYGSPFPIRNPNPSYNSSYNNAGSEYGQIPYLPSYTHSASQNYGAYNGYEAARMSIKEENYGLTPRSYAYESYTSAHQEPTSLYNKGDYNQHNTYNQASSNYGQNPSSLPVYNSQSYGQENNYNLNNSNHNIPVPSYNSPSSHGIPQTGYSQSSQQLPSFASVTSNAFSSAPTLAAPMEIKEGLTFTNLPREQKNELFNLLERIHKAQIKILELRHQHTLKSFKIQGINTPIEKYSISQIINVRTLVEGRIVTSSLNRLEKWTKDIINYINAPHTVEIGFQEIRHAILDPIQGIAFIEKEIDEISTPLSVQSSSNPLSSFNNDNRIAPLYRPVLPSSSISNPTAGTPAEGIVDTISISNQVSYPIVTDHNGRKYAFFNPNGIQDSRNIRLELLKLSGKTFLAELKGMKVKFQLTNENFMLNNEQVSLIKPIEFIPQNLTTIQSYPFN